MVAGPPCPPWSAIGGRGGNADRRSHPSDKLVDILKDQGQKGCYFFVVEMVPGQAHKRSGMVVSDHAAWVRKLQVQAPMWDIQTWSLNSRDYGLPQNRQRLYTVGVQKTVKEAAIPPVPKTLRSLEQQWGSILHPGMQSNREDYLTQQQKLNLLLAEEIARQSGAKATLAHWLISVDRNPRQQFGKSIRFDGLSMTLRTSNEMIWILKTETCCCCSI